MFNPLIEDLSKLKDTDLDNKIADLSRKYHIAARTMGGGILTQLAVTLEHYKNEQSRRQREAMKALAEKSNKSLEGLIKRD
jgi:hypothetical protein